MIRSSSFSHLSRLVLALACVAVPTVVRAGIAEDATAVFKKHCFKCHAPPANKSGFGYINNLQLLIEKEQAVPGNPDASPVYTRMTAEEMPPKGDEPDGRPTAAELEIVAAWIRAGAPTASEAVAPELPPRPPYTVLDELTAIRNQLRSLDPEDRPFWRFFTLRNLYNTPTRTIEEIDYCRAALGKSLNSLSWKQRMVIPVKLDEAGVVYGLDIRDMDWQSDYWREILSFYPYGLKYDFLPDDRRINDVAREVYELAETVVPSIRADWFVTHATRPPLYHTLLNIPENELILEKRLGVDAKSNILQGRVARKGMEKSGISDQHRLIERHDGINGYYWKSYDFKPTAQFGDLSTHPLGPVFDANPYPDLAFTHDGGEFIFRLPNGLQGYMLVNGTGGRIDAGPTDVVADEGKVSGNVEIINGLSCISCHNQGMMFGEDDIVREGTGLGGAALNFMRRLYPEKQKMDAYIKEDMQLFREAVIRSMAGMTENDEALKSADGRVIEPITNLAKGYNLYSLGAPELAAELDYPNPAKLQAIVEVDERFRQIGLGPIATGKGKVKRILWENNLQGKQQQFSPYQKASNYLKLGTPFMVHRK